MCLAIIEYLVQQLNPLHDINNLFMTNTNALYFCKQNHYYPDLLIFTISFPISLMHFHLFCFLYLFFLYLIRSKNAIIISQVDHRITQFNRLIQRQTNHGIWQHRLSNFAAILGQILLMIYVWLY